jgi:radical SAM superfamily enzyme YgiQ (UPF0313 family)
MTTGGTLLVFPPFAESALHGPHLGAALLTAILKRHGEEASLLDLNIRLIRRILQPDSIGEVILAVRARAEPALTARESAALGWLLRASIGGWADEHPASVVYALRVVRRVLYPVPERLEACLLDCSPDQHVRPEANLTDGLYHGLLAPALDLNPAVIGLSVAFSEQLHEAARIARLVRRIKPHLPVLLGGSQINLLQPAQIDLLAGSGLFDEILTPNGETAIINLVHSAKRRLRAKVSTAPAIALIDLKNLPLPEFDEISLYFHPITIPVLATKGCYWGKCAFCDYVRLSDIGAKRYLARPVDEVLAEIASAHRRFAPDRVMLISDAVPPSWYERLAEAAISAGLELRTWSYMMHHRQLSRRYFELLARAGAGGINFGTETTNARVLRLMRKEAAPDAIAANLRDAHGAGLSVIANVIADYPTMSFAEAVAAAGDFEQLATHIDVLNPSMFDLTAGTAAAEDPACHRLQVPDDAYKRSSHGFHTLSFEAETPLTETQKLALRVTYDRLAARIRLKRRAHTLLSSRVADDDLVVLDRGAMRIATIPPSIKLPHLGTAVALEEWEDALLERLLDRPEPARAGDLRRSARAGEDWVERLIRLGLVKEVVRRSSDKDGIAALALHRIAAAAPAISRVD